MLNRREFLHVGSVGALSLAAALRARAVGRKLPNCILVWLDGGPSHLDTFDLKPDAPVEVRGEFNPIETNVPGIRICEHFRKLSRQMDQACIIRSMTSELGEHNFGRHYLLTGYKPTPALAYPSYGSVVAHGRTKETASGLPPYIAVPDASPEAGHGYLPGSARPFAVLGDPSKPDFRVKDLDGPLDAGRLERRKDFLNDFDNLSRQIDAAALKSERDAQFQQAYRLILSPAAKQAFDLGKEKAETRQRYGQQRLGQSCLLARRLVEAGCPFVTVNDVGWDTHQQISRSLKEGYVGGYNGKVVQLDRALSALLSELGERGLLKETLVIVMGEFGRTPKLNTAAGRDHWPRAFSVLLAGGGVKGGQVVGRSDPRGESPAERPITPTDLARTIYTLLGVDPDREFHTADGRPVQVSPGGEVIKEIVG